MSKFEAVLPLTAVQQALLLHHRQAEQDQGEILVRWQCEGTLDHGLLQTSLAQLIKEFSALRTTIHWENIKQEVAILHHDADLKIHWSEEESHQEAWISDEQIPLSQLPNQEFLVLVRGPESFEICWKTHHIFLDGWSTAKIIQRWFDIYHTLESGEAVSTLRSGDMRALHTELKKLPQSCEDQVSQASAKMNLDQGVIHSWAASASRWVSHEEMISEADFDKHRRIILELGLTESQFYQALFALVLRKLQSEHQIAFGVTSSGRSALPSLADVTGVLSNIIPVVMNLKEGWRLQELLAYSARASIETLELEQYSLPSVLSAYAQCGVEVNLQGLFVYENFPWEDIIYETRKITNFSSSFTSNFPLTLVMVPHGNEMRLSWTFDDSIFDAEARKAITSLWSDIVGAIALDSTISDFRSLHGFSPARLNKKQKNDQGRLASNRIEHRLVTIWSEVLGRENVSVDENYFDIGGKSFQALRIMSKINADYGLNITASKLIDLPTITDLSKYIAELSTGELVQEWSALVPLNRSRSRKKLFCIHAGGAHVFAYRDLAEIVKDDLGVFGIQSYGLDGDSEHNQSVESMCAAYVEEIKSVISSGDEVYILGYCFSAAIVMEMARTISELSFDPTLIVVDSAPGLTYGRAKKNLSGRVRRLLAILRNGQWLRIRDMFVVKYDRWKAKYLQRFESEQMRQFRRTEARLAQIYTNYDWREADQEIFLVRSSEFQGRSDKDLHVTWWKKLTKGGLHISVTQGPHFKLFKPPYVEGLAEKILEITNRRD